MGSCTTAEVAIRLQRNVLGFEIREEYLEMGIERLERVIRTLEQDWQQERLI
jgi:DNA modification methylase